MADIGNVNVNFRANVTQFKRGVESARASLATVPPAGTKVADSLRRIQMDVAAATRDLRLGRISTRDYTTAIEYARREALSFGRNGLLAVDRTLTQLNPKLQGAALATKISAAEFAAAEKRYASMAIAMNAVGGTAVKTERGLGATAGAMNKVHSAATKARQGLGTVRSAGASLTARLISMNGTLGTFAGAIGQFAVGTVMTIGIIAGIAAVGGAMRLLGRETREAHEQFKNFLALINKDLPRATMVMLQGYETALTAAHELAKADFARAVDPSVTGGQISPAAKEAANRMMALSVALSNVRVQMDKIKAARFSDELKRMNALALAAAKAWGDMVRQADAATAESERVLMAAGERWREYGRTSLETLREQLNEIAGLNFAGRFLSTEDAIRAVNKLLAEFRSELTQTANKWREYGKTTLDVLRDDLLEIAEQVQTGFLAADEAMKIVTKRLKEFKDDMDKSAASTDKLINKLQQLAMALVNISRGFSIFGAVVGAVFGFVRSGGNPLGGVLGGVTGGFGLPPITPDELSKALSPGTQEVTGTSGVLQVSMDTRPRDPLTIAADAEWQGVLSESIRRISRGGFRVEYAYR